MAVRDSTDETAQGVPIQSRRTTLKREARQLLMWHGVRRYRVLYRRRGAERASPWFLSLERAQSARAVLAERYGGAVVYVD